MMSRPALGEPIPGLAESDTHPGFERSGKRKKHPWEKRMEQLHTPQAMPGYRTPREYRELEDWL